MKTLRFATLLCFSAWLGCSLEDASIDAQPETPPSADGEQSDEPADDDDEPPAKDGGSKDARASDAKSTDARTADVDEADAKAPDAAAVPTWSKIYASYFGPSSIGQCGTAGCHATQKSGFQCSSKSGCLESLVDLELIDTAKPASSDLGSTSASPLTWFGGTMPPKGGASAAAKADITAWLKAGAADN